MMVHRESDDNKEQPATTAEEAGSRSDPPRKGEKPPCFGDSERVLPRDADGVAQPQVACLPCEFLRPCLQSALRSQGVLRPSVFDQPAVSKARRFFKRWSDHKLSRSHPSEGKPND